MKLNLKRPIIFFDLETTGVDTAKDRIVEISMAKIMPDGEEIVKTRKLNPEMHIPEEATAIHGITDEDVKDCPTFAQVAKSLEQFIRGCDFGGFNSNRFDLPVLVEEFLRAGVDALMVFFPDQLAGFVSFSVGGLSGVTWRHVWMLLPYAAAGLFFAVLLSQRLNILLLGDEAATGLGLHVERTRLLAIAVSALLAAASVSVAGLLSFVGLIAPHLIRMLVGTDERYLVTGAALGGAALVMLCDTLGRVVAPPIEVPVGIILAILGAPFFLYVLRGRSKRDVAGKTYYHQLRRKNRP